MKARSEWTRKRQWVKRLKMGAKVEEGEKRGGQKVGSGSEVRKSYFTDYCGCMQLNCAHTDRHIMQSSERRLILTM